MVGVKYTAVRSATGKCHTGSSATSLKVLYSTFLLFSMKLAGPAVYIVQKPAYSQRTPPPSWKIPQHARLSSHKENAK